MLGRARLIRELRGRKSRVGSWPNAESRFRVPEKRASCCRIYGGGVLFRLKVGVGNQGMNGGDGSKEFKEFFDHYKEIIEWCFSICFNPRSRKHFNGKCPDVKE